MINERNKGEEAHRVLLPSCVRACVHPCTRAPVHAWKQQYGFYGGGRDSAQDIVDYMTAVAKGQDPFEAERKSRPGFYKKGGKHESDGESMC